MFEKPEISEGHEFYDHGYQTGDDEFGQSSLAPHLRQQASVSSTAVSAALNVSNNLGNSMGNSMGNSTGNSKHMPRRSSSISVSEHSVDTQSMHSFASSHHQQQQQQQQMQPSHSLSRAQSQDSLASDPQQQQPLRQQEMQQQMQQDAAANPSINFEQVGFFGRRPELQKVQLMYERMLLGDFDVSSDDSFAANGSLNHSSTHSNRSVGSQSSSNSNGNSNTNGHGHGNKGGGKSQGKVRKRRCVPVSFLMGMDGTGKTRLLHQYAKQLHQLSHNPHEDYAITSKRCIILSGQYRRFRIAPSANRTSPRNTANSNGAATGNNATVNTNNDAIIQAISDFCCHLQLSAQAHDDTAVKQLEQLRQRFNTHFNVTERQLLLFKIPAAAILFEQSLRTSASADVPSATDGGTIRDNATATVNNDDVGGADGMVDSNDNTDVNASNPSTSPDTPNASTTQPMATTAGASSADAAAAKTKDPTPAMLWNWTSTLMQFFQIITMDAQSPVLLLLDDIQHANFTFLYTLLSSKTISNLYIVASIRTEKQDTSGVTTTVTRPTTSAQQQLSYLDNFLRKLQEHRREDIINDVQLSTPQHKASSFNTSRTNHNVDSIQFVTLQPLSKQDTRQFLLHALELQSDGRNSALTSYRNNSVSSNIGGSNGHASSANGGGSASKRKVNKNGRDGNDHSNSSGGNGNGNSKGGSNGKGKDGNTTSSRENDFSQLVSAVYAKTNGHFHRLLQTLQELQQKHVLVYSYISFAWEWNCSALKAVDMSSTVVESIQSRIKQKSYLTALTVAAYITTTSSLVFDIDVLSTLITQLQPYLKDILAQAKAAGTIVEEEQGDGQSTLTSILEEAVLESNLQNKIGGTLYEFPSEKIQQAAYNCIPYGEERNVFRYRLGMQLYEMASTKTSPFFNYDNKHWMYVCAANHLNSVPNKNHLLMAQLNLIVGEHYLDPANGNNSAQTQSALGPSLSSMTTMAAFNQPDAAATAGNNGTADYIQAAAYLQKAQIAIRKLRNDMWSDVHYDLSIRLFQARCHVELTLGHFELGHELGCQVLEHATSVNDKLPTYFAMAMAMGRQNRQEEAFQFLRSVLWSIDEYPKRFYAGHAARGMVKVRNYFHSHPFTDPDEFLSRLPTLKDPIKLYTMKFMVQAGFRAFFSKNVVEWMVLLARTLEITLEYGLCESSAMAFCNYAVWHATTGNSQEMALRFAKLARRTVEVTNGKALEGWVLYIISSFIYGWSQPHTQVITTLQHGYQSSMETGEFENGFFNWYMCNLHAYTAGYPLAPIANTFDTMVGQAKLYSLTAMIQAAQEQQKFLRILTGSDYMNWKETMHNLPTSDAPASTQDRFQLLNIYLSKLQLAVYFGRYSIADTMSERLWDISDHTTAYTICVLRNLFSGLTMAGMFRQTQKRKYMKQLHALVKESKELSESRGKNSLHRTLLLEAEYKGLKQRRSSSVATVAAGVGTLQQLMNGNTTTSSSRNRKHFRKVKQAYDDAIACALKSGHIQDAALGCELAGEYFLRHHESELIGEYFTKSVEFYQEWGANAKVKDLERQRIPWLDRARVERAKKAAKEGGLVISRMGYTSNPIASQYGRDVVDLPRSRYGDDDDDDDNDGSRLNDKENDGDENGTTDMMSPNGGNNRKSNRRAAGRRNNRNRQRRDGTVNGDDSTMQGGRTAISKRSGSNPFSVAASGFGGMTAASMMARQDDDNVSLLSYESGIM